MTGKEQSKGMNKLKTVGKPEGRNSPDQRHRVVIRTSKEAATVLNTARKLNKYPISITETEQSSLVVCSYIIQAN